MRELNEKELSQVSGGKITAEFIETTNPAGHAPPGQQDPNAPNEQFTVVTENQNPAGHAPPGQNP
jgi:bacteriocin-like protein